VTSNVNTKILKQNNMQQLSFRRHSDTVGTLNLKYFIQHREVTQLVENYYDKNKEDSMGRTRRTESRYENAYKSLVRNSEGRRPTGRPKRRSY
jgi:hypothetical protein